jgi:HPr kinase/phosphorylase
MRPEPDPPQQKVSVQEFLDSAPEPLNLEVLAGSGGLQSRFISSDRIQKLGLALAGFPDYIHAGRIQILGQSELSYLRKIGNAASASAFSDLRPDDICCIVLTKGSAPPQELEVFATENDIPLLVTPLVSSRAIRLITAQLEEALAPELTIHGVLLEMYGTGVMLLGSSGVGKSECALDLISRGHRLVSDDSVRIKRVASRLIGSAPELIKEHLEIRGLGVLNIKELFGVSAIADRVPIELGIELQDWKASENIERLGLELRNEDLFGISIGKFSLPVSPSRNLAILVETAVRMYLLRRSGYDVAKELIAKHTAMIAGK